MFGKVDGTYVMSSAVVLTALVFNNIGVKLRVCGCDGTRDAIVTGSF